MEDSLETNDEKMTITCPRCGYQFKVVSARVDDEIPCPNCEMMIEID